MGTPENPVTPPDEAPLTAVSDLVTVVEPHDRAVVLAVKGEVDLATAPDLGRAVHDSFDQLHGRRLVLDMSGVTFLASSGIRVLCDAAEIAEHHPGCSPLCVVVHTPAVQRVLQIAGVVDLFDVNATVADALASHLSA